MLVECIPATDDQYQVNPCQALVKYPQYLAQHFKGRGIDSIVPRSGILLFRCGYELKVALREHITNAQFFIQSRRIVNL